MGHVERRELKTGPRYYPIISVAGQRKCLGGYTRKRDAEVRLRRAESEIADGTFGRESSTLDDFYPRWMAAKEKSLKPSTLSDIRQTFGKVVGRFGNLDDIRPMEIQEWVDSLDLSPATTGKYYRYLRSCLRQAQAWGVTNNDPCRGIVLPRTPRREMAFLSPDQLGPLLDITDEPERTLFALLALSGLRVGEALALRWEHVTDSIRVERSKGDFGYGEPKTPESRRTVPLLPSLAAILEPGEGLIFPGLDRGRARRVFVQSLKWAKLPKVTLHSLRHTYASVMLSSGASIKALQKTLGHASATMTLDTYSHLLPGEMTTALERADAVFGAGMAKH